MLSGQRFGDRAIREEGQMTTRRTVVTLWPCGSRSGASGRRDNLSGAEVETLQGGVGSINDSQSPVTGRTPPSPFRCRGGRGSRAIGKGNA